MPPAVGWKAHWSMTVWACGIISSIHLTEGFVIYRIQLHVRVLFPFVFGSSRFIHFLHITFVQSSPVSTLTCSALLWSLAQEHAVLSRNTPRMGSQSITGHHAPWHSHTGAIKHCQLTCFHASLGETQSTQHMKHSKKINQTNKQKNLQLGR